MISRDVLRYSEEREKAQVDDDVEYLQEVDSQVQVLQASDRGDVKALQQIQVTSRDSSKSACSASKDKLKKRTENYKLPMLFFGGSTGRIQSDWPKAALWG